MIRSRLAARRGDESGFALFIVIVSIVVGTMFVTAAFGYALQAQVSQRHSQDSDAALAAAQSGVDDYVARLNQNDSYWQAVDCTNTAMADQALASSCPSWATVTTTLSAPGVTPVATDKWLWQPVNSADPSGPSFHYSVVTSKVLSSGGVQVTATGRSRQVFRTLQVTVGRSASSDFLYFTDYEDADPSNKTAYPGGATSPACDAGGLTVDAHWYASTTAAASRRTGPCVEITFITGDVLDGKVHTNDRPMVTGSPTFNLGFETSDPACVSATPSTCYRDGGSAAPSFPGGPPSYKAALQLTDTSGAFSSYPGCQYTGPTRIKFNADGTMTVWSRNSTGAAAPAAACGSGAVLGTGASVTVSVPTDQVIYVKNGGPGRQCNTGEIGDGLPLAGDVNMSQTDQLCSQGNAYIEGTLNGRVTLATQNSVIVTGDLTPQGGANGDDLLGLVASNSVEVYHPVDNSGNDITAGGYPHVATAQTMTIWAAIQTLQHSFYVQTYNQGVTKNQLTVYGSLAQRWRGIVGQTVSGLRHGYLKNYHYDARLKYAVPPYFPSWVNAVWGWRYSGEIPPVCAPSASTVRCSS